jgi:hypothetical protein
MPIATSLAAALFASTLPHAGAAETPATRATPPMIVTVSAPDLSASLLKYMLEETDALWRSAGVTFVWRRSAREVAPSAPPAEAGAHLPSTLRVTIGDAPGNTLEGQLPLGWIVFDDVTTPEQEIYVSYGNARKFLTSARSIVGLVEGMPPGQRERLLGRAMGRALAHELGHYLMASKLHEPRGLMKATRSAYEFFSTERKAFAIELADRNVVAARLRGDRAVASR